MEKRTCLLLTAVLLLIPNSLEECVIESVKGVPIFVCNTIQDLEEQGNANLFDVTIINNKQPSDSQKTPNLQVILIEDTINGISRVTIKLLKDLSKTFGGHREVNTLSAGFFNSLPIQELKLQQNGIRNIDPGAFFNLTNLQKLYIIKNNLSVLKNGIVNGLPVEILDLSNNKISIIERDALMDMNNLRRLHLDSNRLTEFQPEVLMNHPEKLEILWLQNNYLTEVDRNTVRGFNNLRVLNLENNKITQCSSYTFDNLYNLEILNLGKNLILQLNAEVFPKAGMTNLEKFDMSNNRLSFLTTTMFERVKNLKHIRIGGNPWQCPCLDVILLWLDDHKVQQKCDKDYYSGTRPICVVPENHPTRCVYSNNEQYYNKFSEVTNMSPAVPDCVL